MTHQNHQTNGASLEDCHTNFFALTDLCGIKWRKFSTGERPNASGDPFDDPVLRSYSSCLKSDILCVWRRVEAAPKQELDPTSTIGFDLGPTCPTSIVHPPLSLTAAKELWIFWYGEEPHLEGLVDAHLLKTCDSVTNSGAWETGLSYECRSLLFKALHNLIERCLLSKDIVRLGKWFVQPCKTSDRIFGSSQHLSFSFTFFVHGDTVCASIDLREHSAVQALTPEYLAEAAATAQTNQDASPKRVILAPFGLSGTLTGNCYKADDPAAEKVVEDWLLFYPLCNKDNLELPPVVEVVSGGCKMRYPSKYVLVTDLDKPDETLSSDTSSTNDFVSPLPTQPAAPLANAASSSVNKVVGDILSQNKTSIAAVSPLNGTTTNALGKRTKLESRNLKHLEALNNSNFSNPVNTHAIPSVAIEIPERVWQDCVTNPVAVSIENLNTSVDSNSNSKGGNDGGNAETTQTLPSATDNANANNNETKPLWDFVDPTRKPTCICARHKKPSGSSRSSSGKIYSSRQDKSTRSNRVPFHKRHFTNDVCNSTNHHVVTNVNTVQNPSASNQNNINKTNAHNLAKLQNFLSHKNAAAPGGASLFSDGVIDSMTPNQRSSTVPGTPHGGASSYSRNSIGDSMPVPSVGSPGSAAPSPHPLSAMSQPTSVPPSDQIMSVISPRAPTSVPNLQQPGTPLEQLLDKNTPAPTPTDQHDNKSTTASPYIQPAPSVEPPMSVEPLQSGAPGSVPTPLPSGGTGETTLNNPSTVTATGPKSEQGFGNEEQRSTNNMTPATNANAPASINSLESATATTAFLNLYKTPQLSTKDFDNTAEDEFSTQLLYDFSSMEAWSFHSVKRFKPNEDTKLSRKMRGKNLYDSHTHSKPLMPIPNTSYNSIADNQLIIKKEADILEDMPSYDMNMLTECKTEPIADMSLNKDKSLSDGDYFTHEDLNPDITDLEHLFNPNNEIGVQVHTPPDSNQSANGCTSTMDEIKRTTLSNSNISINNNNNNSNTIRPEDLTKMFPTPPSHEHHPNSSPSGPEIPMTDITETTKIKQEKENYPELGSPVDEPIEDWSHVYKPPTNCTFVGSTKYAPLTNLPSQSLPKLIIPPNCVYKPSWQQPQRQQQPTQQQQQQQQQQQHQFQQEMMMQPVTPQSNINTPGTNPSTPTHHSQSHPMAINMMERETQIAQITQRQQAPTSNLLLNQLNGPPAALNAPGNNPIIQQMFRVGMSPISPATCSPGIINRRTPIHPPPPYDAAVSSPATSTSSYLNKQFNSQDPQTPFSTNTRSPEANSLLINILLYDTALNVFRDHNFDSCTVCVCNDAPDSQKCVGNIRGSDSGIYVALPGTTFNPATSAAVNSNSSLSSGQNSIRSLSAFGAIDSPATGVLVGNGGTGGNGSSGNGNNQHVTGYLDEDPIRCYCGFSALVNRQLAYRSGLFYDDEMEITGIAEDPGKHKQRSILSILANASKDVVSLPSNTDSDGAKFDYKLAKVILDLLLEQCSIIQTSSSSIHRAMSRQRRKQSAAILSAFKKINILEFTDANDIICLAIEQGRLAWDGHSGNNSAVDTYRPEKGSINVHKWPYLQGIGTRNNKDIVRVMQSMQPLLQKAFHTRSRPGQSAATYTVSGPLTWRQFHRLAGRASGQCEPQPIPSVIVGHEKDWLSVAPFVLHYWDKLLLEPYSYAKDIVYLIICPDNEAIISRTKTYFKELSTTYEMCKLGRHTPIKGWDGLLTVSEKYSTDTRSVLEDWFETFENTKLANQLRSYSATFQQFLAPYLARIPKDKTLLDPPDNQSSPRDRSMSSPMTTGISNPPEPSQPPPQINNPMDNRPPSTPRMETDQENRDTTNISAAANAGIDPLSLADDEHNPPVIVLYVVEPFTFGSDSPDLQRIACLALLRCYSELLKSIPESVRCNINIQIISLESILELGRNRSRDRFSDEMKCLALSIFAQCKRYLAHTNTVKSLTGFGTAANMEIFLKSKDEKNRQAYRMYTPPYILAPVHEKSDKTDLFRLRSADQQYSVMYCNYCISEDQSWLLATATDDRGEMLEKIIINIDIPNRTRRKKTPTRRVGLEKLMNFILGIISQTVQPWRLVIGRIGRIGHGELKSWSWLLSKQNLQRASKQLKDICKQCTLLYPHPVPSILSACLVTLEPDSKLRVMPDQFTPDERFSQISMQNPLSTPQDVTCTHILVFPTSAVCQSFQKAFNELNESKFLDGDDTFMFELDEDDENNFQFQDIFSTWDQGNPQPELERNSPHGSPDRMEDNRSRHSPSGNVFTMNRNPNDGTDIEEVGTLLQQPLAVGYFVSTAPTGRMPTWFWASCPHLEDVCPVFLKTALHMHVPGIQQNTDDPLGQNHSSASEHPLDSTLTADVLRYVLEGYNVLSWLALDSNTHDRLSCLPIHVQVLMQLYHMTAAMA